MAATCGLAGGVGPFLGGRDGEDLKLLRKSFKASGELDTSSADPSLAGRGIRGLGASDVWSSPLEEAVVRIIH